VPNITLFKQMDGHARTEFSKLFNQHYDRLQEIKRKA